MRFRTVLFDLDGTLLDHLRAIHRCYGHTLPQLGYPAPTLEQVRRAIGGGLENAMRKFVPEARLAEALRIYRPYWDETMLDDVELLPGARELLTGLHERGVTCAVFTNKHGPSSRRVCEHLGIAPLLRAVYGAGDTPWVKPQPEFAAHVLAELGADAASTLLVGDSPFDVEAARQGGFAAGWCVTTGTHAADELCAAGADCVFAGLGDVRTALLD
jgi:HAD superfamily hydrolase (TIGR01509 family)